MWVLGLNGRLLVPPGIGYRDGGGLPWSGRLKHHVRNEGRDVRFSVVVFPIWHHEGHGQAFVLCLSFARWDSTMSYRDSTLVVMRCDAVGTSLLLLISALGIQFQADAAVSRYFSAH